VACEACHGPGSRHVAWTQARARVAAYPSGRRRISTSGCLRRRQLPEAEKEYRTTLRLDPGFVPDLVNLADLDRARGMDDEGAELLRKALSIEPKNADVQHALGLYLVC
jgi:Tfp pilus assembly protein PilF